MKAAVTRATLTPVPARQLPFRAPGALRLFSSRGHERGSSALNLWRRPPPTHFPVLVGQRRGYAFRKQRPRQLLVDDSITSDVVQLVSLEGRNLGHVALADAKLLAKQKGLRLACVVPLANPPVCRLQRISVVPDIDDDAFDMDGDGDLESPATAPTGDDAAGGIKKRPKGEKELRFSDSIAEHDVQNKVNQLRRFLDKGLRVRVSIYFKSVSQFDPDLARLLLDNIVSRAEDLARAEGDINIASRFATLLLVPINPPQSPSSANAGEEK